MQLQRSDKIISLHNFFWSVFSTSLVGCKILFVLNFLLRPKLISSSRKFRTSSLDRAVLSAWSSSARRKLDLHWLPIEQRIVFKTASVTFRARQLQEYRPTWGSSSNSAPILQRQLRAYSAAAPVIWNHCNACLVANIRLVGFVRVFVFFRVFFLYHLYVEVFFDGY